MGIVIADDQDRERIWLRELLSKNLDALSPIYEAADGQRALELVREHRPPIVFLDIEMPVLSGIKSAEQILKELPQTGVIILSNHSDEIFVRKLWKLVPADGAFGYVLKDSTDQQVIDAANAVLSGGLLDSSSHPEDHQTHRKWCNRIDGSRIRSANLYCTRVY